MTADEVELVFRGIRLVVEVPVEVRGGQHGLAERQRRVQRQAQLVPLVVETLVLEPDLGQVAAPTVDVTVPVGAHVLEERTQGHVDVVVDVPAQRGAGAARRDAN